MWEGIIAGVALGAVNGAAAWLTIRFAWGQSPGFFVKAFLGGMILRLLFVALVVILLFKYATMSKGSFTVALIVTFVIFQVGEIFMIARRRATEQGESASAEES